LESPLIPISIPAQRGSYKITILWVPMEIMVASRKELKVGKTINTDRISIEGESGLKKTFKSSKEGS